MKKIILLLLSTLFLVSLVSAITGSIGNAKMILTVEKEDIPVTLEKYILVKNVNNVSINVKLEPTEEIKDIIKIYDDDFVLNPGEDKKAKFDLKIDEAGGYGGNINVFFTSVDNQGAGIALTSKIIVNAGEGKIDNSIDDNDELDDDNDGNVNVSFGGTGNVVKDREDREISPILILVGVFGTIVGVTAIVFFILIKKVV